MKKLATFEEVLDYAIQNEAEAAQFYRELAEKTNSLTLKESLLAFATEEDGHKLKLESVKEGKIALLEDEAPVDMNLSDFLDEPEEKSVQDYQGLLIIAMKKEKAAYKLYTKMAQQTGNSALSELFTSLAMEEANHKLRFEIEYENIYLTEL